MALPAAGVLEVRTTGNDLNGGGFRSGGSGTDRSLQDAPHVTIDGATISATVHTTTTMITLVGYAVSAADVNNYVQINGGTATAGTYEITAADVPNNRWTLDRAAGTSTQTVIGRMGGALATPGKAGGVKVAQNTIFVKSGTYTLTTSSANVAGGVVNDTTGGADTTGQCFWVGYDTNRTLWNEDANRPVILVPAAGVTSCTVFSAAALNITVRNLVIDGASRTAIRGFYASANFGGVRLFSCKAVNCTDSGIYSNSGECTFGNCEATGCSGSGAGFTVNNASPRFIACHSHDNTVPGFAMGSAVLAHFEDCLSANNSGASSDGFNVYGFTYINNCTSHGNGRDGFRVTGATRGASILNSVATSNGGYGFGTAGASNNALYLQNCAARGNTSGGYDAANMPNVLGFLNLSGDPYANAAGGDFSPNAGAGAPLRGASYPQSIARGATPSYRDIGASQHQESAGSAPAASLLNAGLN